MSVVIIGGTKGGPGKTTIAVNVSAHAANKGKEVLLLDCDPQATTTKWKRTRDGNNENLAKFVSVQKVGDDIVDDILELKNKFDHIIIDAGGYDSTELRSAVTIADKWYAPVIPSACDIWALNDVYKILKLANQFRKEKLHINILFNQVNPNPKVPMLEFAKKSITEFESTNKEGAFRVLEKWIHHRVAYVYSIVEGKCVSELEGKDPKAISEMDWLYKEIFGGN